MAIFEPSHPPLWCKTHSSSNFHYINDSPPSSSFYDLPIHFMTGPTRTASANHRANPLVPASNPPRPPNAWILYRSDKLKGLPSPPPGGKRPPQADISKTISAMWKEETPEIRAKYERLSDIKKAEHQATYPGYRFQPMKKADKDRLRAEKQAEKEKERGTRKSKTRTRAVTVQDPPPLYSTEARFGPAGPSPPASGASTPPAGSSSSRHQLAAESQPTPPSDHPTPPSDYPATRAPSSSSSSSYPPPPSTTSIPPLVAPQPGVLQRPPSASEWQHQQESGESQTSGQDLNAIWMDQNTFPDMAEYGSQEYLTMLFPNHPPQQPLGWSPDDPSPLTDQPFYHDDPLHAVLSATDDPHVYDLGDFDFNVNEIFDGSRPIEVSMGSNMMPSSFGDMSQSNAFNSLFVNWDTSPSQFSPPDPCTVASTSQLSDVFDLAQHSPSLSSATDGLASYSLDGIADEHHRGAYEAPDFPNTSTPDLQTRVAPTQDTAQAPELYYVPPTGAARSSTRRVAADWRHIRMTPAPEPEIAGEVWSGHGR